MFYSELLRHLKPHDIEEVGRYSDEKDTVALLGKLKECIVPFYPTSGLHRIYLESEDPDLDEEEVLALMRRFNIGKLHEDG